MLKAAEERQHETQQQMLRQMAELEKQMQALRLEKEKLEEVEAERERGTAKGRTFEEAVAEAVDTIAVAQGDVAEAVGDLKEATGKVGDVVVAIDACNGPPRGRIVIEAKDSPLSKPKALKELDRALAERSADVAVLVVSSEDEVPAKMQQLREYNGDKLVVAYDPAAGALPLEVAYRLARARVLMKRSDADGIDAGAVQDTAERALAALTEERRIKNQLTGAKTGIDKAYELVDEMSARVRALLQEIDSLVRPAGDPATRAASGGRPDGAVARGSGRCPVRSDAFLGQQQLVVGVLALLADLEDRGADLPRNGLHRAGLDLVAARLERLLDRGGGARLHLAVALDDRLALERDGARAVGLVRDRDLDRAGAHLRGRDGHLVVLNHAGERHAHGRARLVREVVVTATGE